jgi:hypothetical protein
MKDYWRGMVDGLPFALFFTALLNSWAGTIDVQEPARPHVIIYERREEPPAIYDWELVEV